MLSPRGPGLVSRKRKSIRVPVPASELGDSLSVVLKKLNNRRAKEKPVNPSYVTRVFARKALKVKLFRITTVLLAFAAVFILAEIALRIVGWPAPGFYVKGHGPVKLRNPGRDGGAFPPSAIGELRHYDYDVEWTVNKYGFRDSEITPKRPG